MALCIHERDPFVQEMWRRHGNREPNAFGMRDWGWWQYEAPGPRDPGLSGYGQLAKWGLLTEQNIRNIRRHFDERIKLYHLYDGNDLSHIDLAMGEGLADMNLLGQEDRALVRAAREAEDAEDAQTADAGHGKDIES